jgi:tRNA-Thr(GGU) m(6)t(6)A37 methyltransferase TsaA
MNTIEYRPIGRIHSPFKTPGETPIQPRIAGRARGRLELFAEYEPALADLERFSHIILIYHFHLAENRSLKVRPRHEDSWHGALATRAAQRPNPIGLSVVNLVAIDGTTMLVTGIDVVDGTPLLDIKPFIPSIDQQHGANLGWLADWYSDE